MQPDPNAIHLRPPDQVGVASPLQEGADNVFGFHQVAQFDGDLFPKDNLIQGNTALGNTIDVGEIDPSCSNVWKGNTFLTDLFATECID